MSCTVLCECGFTTGARDEIAAARKAARHSATCFKKTEVIKE